MDFFLFLAALFAGLVFFFILLYVLYAIFSARAYQKAILELNALPSSERSEYVIRTDGLFPCVGRYPPKELHYRTKFGMIAYKDPEVGMCVAETCRVLTDDELFG